MLYVNTSLSFPLFQRRPDFNNQGRRRMNNNRSVRAQQEESIRRTVYVSDIDKDVSAISLQA